MGRAERSTAGNRWLRRRRTASAVMAGGLAVTAAVVGLRIEHLDTDSDGDGLPDCRERGGLQSAVDSAGIVTDPTDPDTDGDGVEDGDEVVPREAHPTLGRQVDELANCDGLTYVIWSDPTDADSDDDGLDDAVELSDGFNPLAPDGDEDELDDGEEREWGSDPISADTDADGVLDGEDIHDGSTPITADEPIDDEKWYSEYAAGVGLGEFEDIDSVPQLLGALSGGMSSSIPVVGWALSAVGDLRDVIAGVIDEDWTAVLTSAAAVLPFAGDSAKASAQITKFVERHPEQLRRLVQGILSLDKAPESVRATLLRAADAHGVDGLRELDVTDEMIIRLAQRGTVLASLVKAVDKAAALIQEVPSAHTDSEGFFRTIADASAALRQYAAAADDTTVVAGTPVYVGNLEAPDFLGGRLIDACTRCAPAPTPSASTLRIAKLGSIHDAPAVRSQIEKDAQLIDLGYRLEWHIYAGPTGWAVDPDVLDRLSQAGVPYFVHVPF